EPMRTGPGATSATSGSSAEPTGRRERRINVGRRWHPLVNTADLNPHLDLDTLADLAEGLLDEDQAASAGEHLESCPQCRDLSAELADVSRILAEAPMPPLPAELAERLDAAIAAEVAANPPGEHHHMVIPLRRRRFQ